MAPDNISKRWRIRLDVDDAGNRRLALFYGDEYRKHVVILPPHYKDLRVVIEAINEMFWREEKETL